jgi:hypothetical protein
MLVRHRKSAVLTAAAALFTVIAAAQPASAETQDFHVSFYAGVNGTGAETVVDLDAVGECVTLAQPARSAVNIAAVDVEVYYKPDCVTGLPGQNGDLHFVLGSLHQANFSPSAVSYRVRPMGG